jgi:gamma-aminobutyric acid type B receptor
MRIFLFSLLIVCIIDLKTGVNSLSLGLINGNSAFFHPVRDGWEAKCKLLGVDCLYTDSNVENLTDISCIDFKTKVVKEWIRLKVDGIAIEPCWDALDEMRTLVEEALASGIPITTFDSDIPDSKRAVYVGTDQVFFGRTLAKLLRQLRPEGGTYVLVGDFVQEQRAAGFIAEISRYNDRDDRAHWYAAETPPDIGGRSWLEMMEIWAQQNPTAFITLIQSPMREANWTVFVDAHYHQNITYIGADGADYQLAYLNRRYVDALVGQLPFDFGFLSAKTLFDIVTTGEIKQSVVATNLVAYNTIPLELPPEDYDPNLLGSLKALGYTLFAVVAASSITCIVWTLYHRAKIVVRASQPVFLVMVASGVLVMASTMVPLSLDDGGDPESKSESYLVGICMSVPWLAFTGFTLTFSALVSKTWRVNKILHSKVEHARIKVTEKDVLAPLFILLTCNIIVLVCWTAIDPLTYVRVEEEGTDYWNRPISSYGTCRSENASAYLAPLAVLNFAVIVLSCWQAYQARSIQSEFSEARYIGLAVASLFQAFVTGIPVVVVVRDSPEAYYILLTLMFFLICMTILLLIFWPKMIMAHAYSQVSELEQKRMVRESLKNSKGKREDESSTFMKSGSISNMTRPKEDSLGLGLGLDSSGPSGPLTKIEPEEQKQEEAESTE